MTGEIAILIEPDGEITTPYFAGLAGSDHPGGRLWHVRDLIDSAAPDAIETPNSGRLVFWIDGRARTRMRSVNMVASVIFADTLGFPLQALCGSVLITGGSAEEPWALTSAQVAEALGRLDLEPLDADAEG